MDKQLDISVVVPLFNEEDSLSELTSWIDKVMQLHNFSYEVILVDDGSRDGSWKVVEQIAAENNNVKGIQFRRNYGKSAALFEGFDAVIGDVVITMDADLQDSPEEIPDLYKMIMKDDFDLVSGWKKKRYDPITKTIPTKLFNSATRQLSGIKLNDFNCGLKAYKRNVVKTIEVYGEMHRYIPVLAKQAGFVNIGEKVVEHQARKHGTSKFGLERFVNGFLDLMSISFMTSFGKRPMHFFGLLGTLSFIVGFGISVYLTILKIAFNVSKMTDRPIFYLGLLCMIVGTQLFITGFIGEMISRSASDRNKYSVKGTLNL
jgi:glycosyltransferase involved in cell wall biosynthesis